MTSTKIDDRSITADSMEAKTAIIGAVLILTAAFFWGVSGGIGGILINEGWDPFVITFYRGALTLGFAVIWLLASAHENHGFKKFRLWAWSACAGAGVAGAFSFYFLGMKTGSVAVAATLLYSAPVFVFLTGFIIGSERVTFGKVTGLVMVAIGVSLLTGVFSTDEAGLTPLSLIVGILAGVSYAVFIFGFQHASSHGSVQAVMAIAFSVQTLILLAIVGTNAWNISPNYADIGLIAFLGVIGGGFSFLLYIHGLRKSRPAIASITAMAEPITASCFGLFWLAQSLSALQLLGALSIVGTVTTLNVIYSRTENR